MDKQKKDNKKPTNNFEIEKLNSYKNCKLDIQNLQKISEKVEQTGLVALVGLAKKIVSFYNDVYDHCEKNKLKTTDYFNLTTIRKNLYELVDYPQQEDADGKPKIKIRLNGEQIAIYDFCILLLVKAAEKDRDIIALRNFPIRRSFRQLQKFFLPNSHEKVRNDYYLALYELLKLYHSKGQKYFLK